MRLVEHPPAGPALIIRRGDTWADGVGNVELVRSLYVAWERDD